MFPNRHDYGKAAAALLLVFMMMAAAAVSAANGTTDFDRLLDRYEQAAPKARTAAANALFGFLNKAQFTDEPVQLKANTPADTVAMLTDYWAAEYLFNEQQQPERAAVLATRALPLCRTSRDPEIAADCLSLLSACHFRKGEWKVAANYAQQLYELDKRSGDADRMSSSLNTLAAIYLGAKQPHEAEKYILHALKASQQTDNKERRAVIQGMAAEIYHAMGNEQQALDYASKAYELEQSLGRKSKAAIRLSQMASAHIALGNNAEAKDALAKAIPQLRTDSNRHSLAICLNQMGDLLMKEKNTNEAIKNYREALQLHIAQGDLYNESHARKGLYEALKDSDPQEAMQHIERYNELKDSLYDHETGELLSKYNAQYGNEQLQQDNEEQRRQKRSIAITALAVTAALIIIIGVLWSIFRRRQKGNRRENDRLSQHIDQLRQQHNQLKEKYANILFKNHADSNELTDEDRKLIDRVIKFTHDNMEQGTADIDHLADELCMSSSNLRRRITSITGEKPANYLLKLRLEEARHLMDTRRDLSISDVAMKCGFDDKSNFARTFRRVFGVSPSEYQRGEQKQ